MRVLGFGDNVVDRFLDRGTDYPGGNCVNVAVHARRLGADAAYLGVFGDDGLGSFLRSAVAAQGVALERSVVRHGESGVSTLEVRDGDRVFLDYNGGGVTVREPLELDAGLLAYAASFSLVHSSVYSRTESQLPRLAGAGPLVSFDLSDEDEYRTPEYLDRICPHADLVLLSCSRLDEPATRALLAEAVRRGAGLALATRGLAGAVAYDGLSTVAAPARPVVGPRAVADTMGCGDAFLAGFVVSLLRDGWSRAAPPSPEALDRALRQGAEAAYQQCFVEAAFGGGRPAPAGEGGGPGRSAG
ncbi:PfkB family carbohydrate kinase [Streptomyces sp. LP05-1]|uniref:PfkB family carbohydrate kinase n=1 Tax=Streptomyces pyxinae TaxID=2970734 RepID=A0ABT2CEH9_9ACTN|nr:PfkB family carbohydrate kinase [Streptomyces sp. LP05-1]MCS0635812.1 PfkB family carbohydrate kinase [Streptomyces sp. LP05-1]